MQPSYLLTNFVLPLSFPSLHSLPLFLQFPASSTVLETHHSGREPAELLGQCLSSRFTTQVSPPFSPLPLFLTTPSASSLSLLFSPPFPSHCAVLPELSMSDIKGSPLCRCFTIYTYVYPSADWRFSYSTITKFLRFSHLKLVCGDNWLGYLARECRYFYRQMGGVPVSWS